MFNFAFIFSRVVVRVARTWRLCHGWSLSFRWLLGEWISLLVGEENNIELRQGTEIWSASSSRVETGLEDVYWVEADGLVREVIPLGGYSVAEEIPTGRALSGLDLKSFFVTPDRTGWAVFEDGVHVLGQG